MAGLLSALALIARCDSARLERGMMRKVSGSGHGGWRRPTDRRRPARLPLCSEEVVMQVHPGVFVSTTSTEEWRPDPEIGGGAEEHVLIDTGAMRAGLSRFAADADPQPPPWVLPQTQILLVLEGGARIDIEDGPTLDLGPGDMASLPKGAVTRWHLTLPFKELWVLA